MWFLVHLYVGMVSAVFIMYEGRFQPDRRRQGSVALAAPKSKVSYKIISSLLSTLSSLFAMQEPDIAALCALAVWF
jgi:hypothetical protein